VLEGIKGLPYEEEVGKDVEGGGGGGGKSRGARSGGRGGELSISTLFHQ
jgi:hypothetical protein